MPEINWIGALVAGVVGFLIGAAWHSPLLFGKRWQAETGVDPQALRHPLWMPMTAGFLSPIVGAMALSALIGPTPSLMGAVVVAAVIGALIVAPAIKTNGLFRQDSIPLITIEAGFVAVQYIAMGVVLGLWQ